MPFRIKRILVYTHNAIGLGHAFRTLAVLTGIRRWRPDIDFLVLSGTSVPHVFLQEGIEIIKLPAVKMDLDKPAQRLQPRYLTSFKLEDVFDYRQWLILAAFDFFKPDALFVEHNMAGLMNEVIPLLLKKRLRRGGSGDFPLVHLSRGILRDGPILSLPWPNPQHLCESINIRDLFDFLYVLEDNSTIDVSQEYLNNDRSLEHNLHYLGPITVKAPEDLPGRDEVLRRHGLVGKRVVLLTLGRHGQVAELTRHVLTALAHCGLSDDHQIVMVLDPYLDAGTARGIQADPLAKQALILPFIPCLVDLIHAAELVICRAGYNTVNEVLMTGAKALVIPEQHPSGEQERRARFVPRENISVTSEQDFLAGRAEGMLLELLNRKPTPMNFNFDKYAIGRRIMEDLEGWMIARGPVE
jgi:predicted glycosyltransferase